MNLPSVRLIATNPNLDSPQRHRIRRRSFALAGIIDDAVAVVIKTIRAFVRGIVYRVTAHIRAVIAHGLAVIGLAISLVVVPILRRIKPILIEPIVLVVI